MQNRGKQFEKCIEEALEAVPCTTVDRQHDQTTGYLGSSNICDFIAYHYPHQYYFECKSCHGNTLSIYSKPKIDKNGVPRGFYGNITDTQWNGLLDRSSYPGVIAGYFIWFIDHDMTIFIEAKKLEEIRNAGEKSLNFNKFKEWSPLCYIVPGKKRRILFDYDLKEFIGE